VIWVAGYDTAELCLVPLDSMLLMQAQPSCERSAVWYYGGNQCFPRFWLIASYSSGRIRRILAEFYSVEARQIRCMCKTSEHSSSLARQLSGRWSDKLITTSCGGLFTLVCCGTLFVRPNRFGRAHIVALLLA
jgi:hypothetical protein